MFKFLRKAKSEDQSKLDALLQEHDDLKDEVKTLKREKRTLKESIAEMELEKKMGDEDIKHMVKMQTEQNDITLQKATIAVEKKAAEDVAEVKDKYRDKMEEQLTKETENIKEMYSQILERLPNVSMNISQKDG